MASNTRKQARTTVPVTRHPLFPAIVALWFGALFGLGSLAVRPGLIEQFVLATHLDTIVSAAAPPIGMTARILLALVMTGLGGAVGATIARRIARPKVKPQPRRRYATPSQSADAPRAPLSRSEYAAAEDSPSIDGMGQKRRSLTVPEDFTQPDFVEHAPLPGGPMVLDLADAAIEEPAPVSAFAQTMLDARGDEAAIASSGEQNFGAPAWHQPVHQEPLNQEPVDQEPVHLELEKQEQVQREPVRFEPVRQEPVRQVFQPAPAPVHAEPESAAFAPWAPAPAFAEPRDEALPAAMHDHAPTANGLAPAAIFATSSGVAPNTDPARQVFQLQPPAAPLFAPLPVSEASPARDEAPMDAQMAAGELQPADHKPEAAPAAEAAEAPSSRPEPSESEPVRFVAPGSAAAERLVGAELDELSPVQLIERLAITLQRRREATKQTPAPQPAQTVAAPTDLSDEHPLAAFLKPAAAAPLRLPPQAESTPATAPEPAPEAAPAPAFEPTTGSAAHLAFDEAGHVPKSLAAIPAALRPVLVEPGDPADEDLDDQLAFVTRRHITMPQAAPERFRPDPGPDLESGQGEEPGQPHAVSSDVTTEAGSEPTSAEEYSSLLDIARNSQARADFVRIEDEVDPDSDIEPVVSFPGGSQPRLNPVGAASFAKLKSPFAEAPVRRFDPPGMSMAASVDKEESERALRAALATLQRMSGAA